MDGGILRGRGLTSSERSARSRADYSKFAVAESHNNRSEFPETTEPSMRAIVRSRGGGRPDREWRRKKPLRLQRRRGFAQKFAPPRPADVQLLRVRAQGRIAAQALTAWRGHAR